MTKKKAIEILKNQIVKFDNIKIYRDETWIHQTASYIKDFFGENSTEYKFVTTFEFDVEVDRNDNENTIDFKIKSKMENMKQFIKNCIEKISINGLYKHPKTNIVSDKNNYELLGIIAAISFVVYGIGYYFGVEKTNLECIETKVKYEKLKESFPPIESSIQTKSLTNKKNTR